MSLAVNQLAGLSVILDTAAAVVTRTFAAATASTSDLTTYTFSAHALGTAAANRKTVVCVMARAGAAISVSSLTVDGVSATRAIRSAASGTSQAEIWVADTPSNTTGDIVVTWSGGAARCAIAVYAMYGAGSSTPTATAVDVAVPMSQSLTIPVGGAAFGCMTSSDNITVTWTNLTEDADATYESQVYTSASKESALGETSTISVASPTDGAFCAAAFGP